MRTRTDYERACQVVREVVHLWDPYGLIHVGCPPDEFGAEIAAVVRQAPRIRSRNDAAHALSRVFSSAFEPSQFRPEDCAAAGDDLYEALSATGLIPTP